MIVFKNYFKIVKKHLGLIIMFAAISISIAIANTSYSETDSFVNSTPKLAIINYDKSTISQNFEKYITEKSEIIEIENNEKSIQDSLYSNKVDAILIVPENFSSELLSGKEPVIRIKKSAKNSSEYIELMVNRYFRIVECYHKSGIAETEIITNLQQDLENEVDVKIANNQKSDMSKLAVFYSFENYAFLSIFIFIIGTIMCIFNKETIVKRNNISKMKPSNFMNQILLGHMALVLCIWGIFVLASIIIYKDLMFNINGLLLIINSLCFAITTTALAYLIGSLIKKQNIISGVQNILSLGLSFISGCFVPIEFLDKSIVNFSKVFPSYWFIKGNYDIVKITTFNMENLKPIIQNYLIILLFGILYYSICKIKNKIMLSNTGKYLKNI
ncbi:MAG: ABC transporter permease [Clostridiales bacterium]|nr:ABC transporter permease [Clostridiales bacterium]